LHNLAREKGKTIVATIHQPSSHAFTYVDKLFLMAEGEIIYFGRAKKAEDYFTAINFPLPRFKNCADSLMKYATFSYPHTSEDKKRKTRLNKAYKEILSEKITEDI
jgi:ABC-type multidrug transport system ATPase subunit